MSLKIPFNESQLEAIERKIEIVNEIYDNFSKKELAEFGENYSFKLKTAYTCAFLLAIVDKHQLAACQVAEITKISIHAARHALDKLYFLGYLDSRIESGKTESRKAISQDRNFRIYWFSKFGSEKYKKLLQKEIIPRYGKRKKENAK